MQLQRRFRCRTRRRAGVAVQLAVSSTVIFGMGALAVDIGSLYTTRTELQVSADAAALAAAAQLGSNAAGDPRELAIDVADEYARKNTPHGYNVVVLPNDVEFGQATFDPATGKYVFDPGGERFDSVRVTVRHTEGNGVVEVPFLFAPFLGQESRVLQARATAVFIPRDISVVIDLSNSMSYDSQLRYYDREDGGYSNLRDIWCALDGPEPDIPYVPASAENVDQTQYAADTGPTYGWMTQWGHPLDPAAYDAAGDPGLWRIERSRTTSVAAITERLVAAGYIKAEVDALLSGAYDSNATYWKNRVGVLLGLAVWHSGMPGSNYPRTGNGNTKVESSETHWIPMPEYAHGWHWSDYIGWVGGHFLSEFRYRYGLKTYVDFLLASVPRYSQTDIKWATPEQPTRAVKDAVWIMTNVISALDSLDQIALETFDRWGHHEEDLSLDLWRIPNTLYGRQAGHYDLYTNIGDGLKKAYNELRSERARGSTAKLIVLMSDGVPNRDENGNSNMAAARQYAIDMAQLAADEGMRIYTVSVGYESDRELMQEIATIGGGQEFYAAGNPEEYTEQLEMIFRSLGGQRPVALIE